PGRARQGESRRHRMDLRFFLRLRQNQRRVPHLSKELEKILQRLEQLLPPPPPTTDWKASVAFRWRATGRRGSSGASAGWLQPVRHVHKIRLADLRGIDEQIAKV